MDRSQKSGLNEDAGSVATELRPTSQRTEAFSDAVFAIAATIMMFEIKIPDSLASFSDRAVLNSFAASIGTYALSYLVILTLWVSHHYLIFIVRQPDRKMIWLNSLMLFFISLIPMGARFFGSNPMSGRAAAAYGFILLLCTASFGLLRFHAAELSDNEVHRSIHRRVLRKILMTIAVYAASIPLAFLDVRLAWACFLVTPVMFFVPVVRASSRARSAR